ncbi:MAG: DUF1801 domain-containing protein [Patescibacteria group bacterium]
MAKYINKTQPTTLEPEEFLKQNCKPELLKDSLELLTILKKITGSKAVLWTTVIGFGKYHYISKACEADWFVTGFAPRASTIAIYTSGKIENKEELVKQLGKAKLQGTCIHIKKLSDINLNILEEIIKLNIHYMKENYVLEL